MMQVATGILGSAASFEMTNCGDAIPSDLPGYVYAPFPPGSANVLTIDGSGKQSSKPIGGQSPSETQYLQLKATDGAGVISVQIGGAKIYACITGLQ